MLPNLRFLKTPNHIKTILISLFEDLFLQVVLLRDFFTATLCTEILFLP